MPDENELLLKQRAALVRFGRCALKGDDIDEILSEACVNVVEGLGLQHAKIVERVEGRDELFVRAWTGFDLTEEERWIPAGERSSAGHSLLHRAPNLSGNVDTDNRFDVVPFVRRAGVKSLVNVLIPDDGGEEHTTPWGVLEADSVELDAFDENGFDFLRQYANLIASAIDRRAASRRLERAIEARDVLLKEVNHRVKNSLQLVQSVLRMEMHEAEGTPAAQRLEAAAARVQAIAAVHTSLYHGDDVHTVEFSSYAESLCGELANSFGAKARGIALAVEADKAVVPTETAIALGLILNEFVTNAFKHAFPGNRQGKVRVSLRRLPGEKGDGGAWALEVRDDGEAAAKGKDGPAPSGLGTRIVDTLARQIGAEVTSGRAAQGWSSRLEFSL